MKVRVIVKAAPRDHRCDVIFCDYEPTKKISVAFSFSGRVEWINLCNYHFDQCSKNPLWISNRIEKGELVSIPMGSR